MFYEQLFLAQIPKAQKNNDDLIVFVLLGSAHIKASRNYVGEINPRLLLDKLALVFISGPEIYFTKFW